VINIDIIRILEEGISLWVRVRVRDAPDDVQKGDLACLFQELDLLLVLRSNDADDTYKLVGDIYVYGGDISDEGEDA